MESRPLSSDQNPAVKYFYLVSSGFSLIERGLWHLLCDLFLRTLNAEMMLFIFSDEK